MSQNMTSGSMAGFPGMCERRQWELTWEYSKPGSVNNLQLLLGQNRAE